MDTNFKKRRKNPHAVIASDSFLALHKGSPNHPERPARLTSILNALKNFTNNVCKFTKVSKITTKSAEMVHSKRHIHLVKKLPEADELFTSAAPMAHNGAVYYEFNDMFWNRFTSKCALLSAGTVMRLAQRVASQEIAAGFAVVRPPGHHAGPRKAEGFCWMNNVAIAARAVLARNESVKKVLIVDWDVHHGNGTQEIFYEDSSVLYISLHRYGLGFYPGSGAAGECGIGPGEGFSVNIPWRQKRMGDKEYIAAFRAVVCPLFKEFQPDLTLVSAGFDAAKGDQVGEMDVTPACYGWMTGELFRLSGGKNLVFALEGGYCLNAISNSVLACVNVMGKMAGGFSAVSVKCAEIKGAEKTTSLEPEKLVVELSAFWTCRLTALKTIRTVLEIQSQHWKTLQAVFKEVDRIVTSREKALGIQISNQKETSTPSVINEGYFAGLGALSSYMEDLYE